MNTYLVYKKPCCKEEANSEKD